MNHFFTRKKFGGFDVRRGACRIASGLEDLLSEEHTDRNKIEDYPVSIKVFRRYCMNSKKTFKGERRDCVVSIPSYFNEKQRREFLDTAKNSGLNVLRLMHECTAIALSYGFYKHFAPDKQSIVAFVYIEASDTQISIARFRLGKMEILSHASDSSLGVNSFDEVLSNYNSKAYEPRKSARGKVRSVFRDNKEPSYKYDRLIRNICVNGVMSREKFDHLCSESLIRIATVCSQAIADAEVPLKGIDAVELIGLGCKLTSISKVIHSVFRKQPNCSLNASESIAKGCALQCALLTADSVSINYEIIDALPFSIRVSSNEDAVFKRNNPFPATNRLNKQTICSFLWENFDKLVQGPNANDESKRTKNQRKLLNINLDINGIMSLKYEKLKNDENVDEDDDDAYDNNSLFKDEEAKVKSKVTITESICSAMSKADVAAASKQELILIMNDKEVEEAESHKYSLESYVYGVQNKLDKIYAKLVEDQEKVYVTKRLEETKEWLDGQGKNESKEVYMWRLKELEKIVESIVKPKTKAPN